MNVIAVPRTEMARFNEIFIMKSAFLMNIYGDVIEIRNNRRLVKVNKLLTNLQVC